MVSKKKSCPRKFEIKTVKLFIDGDANVPETA